MEQTTPIDQSRMATIESIAARPGRAGAENARMEIRLSVPLTEETMRLFSLLGFHLKGKVSIHFGDVQLPLEEEELKTPAEQERLRPRDLPQVEPHPFMPGTTDDLGIVICATCYAPALSLIHEDPSGNVWAYKKTPRLPSRRPVGDQERQEAEAALANASKQG